MVATSNKKLQQKKNIQTRCSKLLHQLLNQHAEWDISSGQILAANNAEFLELPQ